MTEHPYPPAPYPPAPYVQELAVKRGVGRALAATITLGACVLLLIVHAGLAAWGTHLADPADPLVHERVESLFYLLDVLGLAEAAATVATAVALIVWLWRARANAVGIGGTPQQWGRPWMIIGWMVPILNFWVPRMIVADVWRASAPAGRRAWPVNLWWPLWLIYVVGGRVLSDHDGMSLQELYDHCVSLTALALIGVAAAALAFAFVWQITGFQEAHARRLAQATAPPDLVRGWRDLA
ncbi:DUF4328 domain-containing protein [Spirillospora sp. NBC_01491]|uniref:DUF4328 domain-containing protein n=1 Tax=Spirillospora sp. NBC_01491 TaxID=2976007 RepID=UPI002E36A601|nr:DUF4328 domain-containing protein [Spirillospora sp. NBC_01491]